MRVVLRHAGVKEASWNAAARNGGIEALPIGQVASTFFVQTALAGKDAGDLAGAVGAEVEIDATVFISNARDGLAAIVDAHERHYEFIGHTVVVRSFHRLRRIDGGATFAFSFDHCSEG